MSEPNNNNGNATEQTDEDIIIEKLKQLKNEQAEMKKFLVIKSTKQQLREGVEQPVDTAYIESRGGRLHLKAVFEVKNFKPEEINVQIVDNRLEMTAQCLDDQENAIYRKTMVRQIDLPDTVDTTAVDCVLSEDGILTVTMPFYLPQSPQPSVPPNPALVPIVTDDDGRRYIRLEILIGPDFTIDDVKVSSVGHALLVRAWYEAQVGADGVQVTRRELKKEFRIPENIHVESIRYDLTEDGVLQIEILLAELEEPYICYVDTEDVVGAS